MKIFVKITLKLVPVFIALLFTNCHKEEILPRDYPRINTLPVNNISSSGAQLNAEIVFRGNFKITSYGFVWSEIENPVLENSDRVIYSDNIHSDKFSFKIITTLKEGVTYNVRAFIQTKDYLVYGDNVKFLSLGSKAPQIESIEPLKGTIGDTIYIYGNGFSYLNVKNQVFFDEIPANIILVSNTLIKSIVPVLSKLEYRISISVIGNVETFNQVFNVTTPIIDSFYPQILSIDDTLIINGKNFSYHKKSNLLLIGGIESDVIFSNKEMIKAIIPPKIKIQNAIELTIAGQKTTWSGYITFLEPFITNITPTQVSFGDTILIQGENLSFINENNKVLIDDIQAIVVASSKNEVQFIFPENISKSQNTLHYEVAGKVFSFEYINVLPPIIYSISPDYLSAFYNGQIELTGENFNPLINKNLVLINGIKASITGSSVNKITMDFPRALIPDVEISVLDTVDINLSVLDQNTDLVDGLIIEYHSRWTRKRDFPGITRIYPLIFTVNSKIYVGLGESGPTFSEPNWLFYSDFWSYDPNKDYWEKKTDFPGSPRSCVTALVFGTKVYVIGGISTYPCPWTIHDEVWEYDVLEDNWTQKNNFPGGKRTRTFGLTVAEKGYLGGGEDECGRIFNDLWKYNHFSDTWSQQTNLPISVKPTTMGGYSTNDFGFIISSGRNIMVYYPVSDSWSYLTSSPFGDMGNSCFVLDEKIYIGLNAGSNFSGGNRMYKYDLLTESWSSIIFKGERRSDESSISVSDKGYILLGRYDSHSANLNDIWEFDPSKP